MPYALSLPQHEARLAFLAVIYHLGRPGSEIDRDTLTVMQHGLAEVVPRLEEQINDSSARVELSAYQLSRLGEAMLGAINELKTYPMLDAMSGGSGRPRSAAAGFDEAMRRLFPPSALDANYATRLAEDMLMLWRRMESAVSQAETAMDTERRRAQEATRHKGFWPFGRR
jgi:hypothetical protein